jgi:dethiobiotin synthetase
VQGLFVTGTDTGAGKTVVAAAVCAALAAQGRRVAAFKPVVTGTGQPAETGWPPDHELLAAVTAAAPGEVAPVAFPQPVSPHLAAELAGTSIEPAALVSAARRVAAGGDALVVEGVGGIMVPLTTGYLVRDLARELALPVVVAARAGLGTINHTLLTLEALRAVGLEPAGVVLTPWPDRPGTLEHSNRDTIALLGRTEVATVPHLPRADREALARAGAQLPLERWIR